MLAVKFHPTVTVTVTVYMYVTLPAGGPEAAGVPRRGVDQPGGYETIHGDLPERLSKAVDVEGLPDTLARVGESVGGALQHIVQKTGETVQKIPESAGEF